jgi:hypothetical protein
VSAIGAGNDVILKRITADQTTLVTRTLPRLRKLENDKSCECRRPTDLGAALLHRLLAANPGANQQISTAPPSAQTLVKQLIRDWPIASDSTCTVLTIIERTLSLAAACANLLHDKEARSALGAIMSGLRPCDVEHLHSAATWPRVATPTEERSSVRVARTRQ